MDFAGLVRVAETHRDGGARAPVGVDAQAAAERTHDAIAEDHAHAVTAVFGVRGDGVLQQTRLDVGRDARAVVAHANLMLAVPEHFDMQRGLGGVRERAQRVRQQRGKYERDAIGHRAHDEVLLHVHGDPVALGGGERIGVEQRGDQARGAHFARAVARERGRSAVLVQRGPERRDQREAILRVVEHRRCRARDAGLRVGVEFARHVVFDGAREQRDGRQRRVQFMREKRQCFIHCQQPLLTRFAFGITRHRLLQHVAHRLHAQRLFEDAEHIARVDRVQQHVLVGIRRHQNAHDLRIFLRDFLQQLVAVALGHAEVGHQHRDLRAMLREHAHGFLRAARDVYRIEAMHGAREVHARNLVVVDEENGEGGVEGGAGHRIPGK
ncbi:hypothetical protein PT2222_170089 [Paraburkholderia tropica]